MRRPVHAVEVPSAHFDAIVVGSGMGGLTFGSLLAQLRGASVLVLERHYRLGGFTHAFTRPRGLRWDVGLHYVGEMGPAHRMRRLMDLVTGGTVEWQALPNPFERYFYPGLTVDQPSDRSAYVDTLAALWPEERRGIERYFSEVDAGAAWLTKKLSSSSGLWRAPGRSQQRPSALCSTAEVLDRCVRSPELKGVLASQWGNYGLPPRRSAFVAHAMTVSHYLSGGWFPVGGSDTITAGARAQIERAGGACLINHEVEQILIEDGRAVGVRVRRGHGRNGALIECRAPLIVSDAGARVTYERLVPHAQPTESVRTELRGLPPGYGVVQCFLGLNSSARTLGIRGENHWLFNSYDHDAMWEHRNDIKDGHAGGAYLSFPSLKDSSAQKHTAEIIAPLDYEVVAGWATQSWLRRGVDYEGMKDRIVRALLELVERTHPGFGALVDYSELATPLTVVHFTGHDDGAVYGLPAVAERFSAEWYGPMTPVPGLMLTGSDVAMHGVVGAMMGGVTTAGVVLGAGGFLRIIAAAERRRT